MKKLFLILFIFAAFSCQDMMTDEASRNSQINSDVTDGTASNKNADIVNPDIANIVAAFDNLKKDTEAAKRLSLSQSEHERQVEITKQMFLILYNLRSEMPESLKNSQDWAETMKRDPAAAAFGNKLKAEVDKLPPEFQVCGILEWIQKLFNCFWVKINHCASPSLEGCLLIVMEINICMMLPCSPF